MVIEYKDQKNLPCDQLYRLFLAVGWAEEKRTTRMMRSICFPAYISLGACAVSCFFLEERV